MTNLLIVAGTGISIVSFIGLCFVYLRGSADKGTIESQARLIQTRGTEIDDLTRRVAIVEAENTALKAKNATLHDAVSHVEELVQLQHTLDDNHSEMVAVLGRILVALEGLTP